MAITFKSGWVKDSVDERDYLFKAKIPVRTVVKASVDLRPTCPPVIDQGDLGSCTACATTVMVQYVRKLEKFQNIQLSPLFTYYSSRLLEGTVNQDAGASVRDALISTVKYGVVPELFWRYDIKNFKTKPPSGVWTEALKHQTLQYLRLNNSSVNDILVCLSQGFPFTFGLMVYESFLSGTTARTGLVPLPNTRREKLAGGHCMVGVGYEGTGSNMLLIVQNSWSTKWGNKGFCKIPMSYITDLNLCFDLWTIRTTES